VTQPNNQIKGWKYYNHAAIPTSAPHEVPDLTPVKDGSIWNIEGKKPLLVRYTTDWDCGYDTGWWYIIKDAPFDISALSSSSRKHINSALRKVRVERINAWSYAEELYECCHQAFLGYKLASNEVDFDSFRKSCNDARFDNVDYWAGFDIQTNQLVGYMTVESHTDWAEICVAKFDPRYLKLHTSDALYATVLDFYLNQKGKQYVSSGARSISHVTNTQEYKEQHFGYRKAYCRLNIVYHKNVQKIVALLYPFRRLICFIGKYFKRVHLVSSVLKMEEIKKYL